MVFLLSSSAFTLDSFWCATEYCGWKRWLFWRIGKRIRSITEIPRGNTLYRGRTKNNVLPRTPGVSRFRCQLLWEARGGILIVTTSPLLTNPYRRPNQNTEHRRLDAKVPGLPLRFFFFASFSRMICSASSVPESALVFEFEASRFEKRWVSPVFHFSFPGWAELSHIGVFLPPSSPYERKGF